MRSLAHICFLLWTIFACPLSPPWNQPFFSVELTLFTPCSCSDPPLSRQGAALAHLNSLSSHDLVIRTDGLVPFRFDKGDSDVIANCSLCGTEATLSFSVGLISSSFSAKACTILQTFCWPPQDQ